jgi:acetoacetate decarboxylase
MNEYENTDKEIWREIEGEYYSPNIFVTEQGKIGINVGGVVYVQSVEKWHQQAYRIAELEKQLTFQPNQTLACPSYLSGLTPQIKELSNKEIEEVMYKCDWAYDPVAFARAILKKASEK